MRRTTQDVKLPSDTNYITPPTDRRKCGAERVSFSGEGSISVPSPVKHIKFEKQGRAQEQSALCAAHVTVTAITVTWAADVVLLFDIRLVVKVLIPSPRMSSEFRPCNPSTLPMMMMSS